MSGPIGAPRDEQIEGFIDDVDGTPAVHCIRIGWGDEWREIRLSDNNLAALAKEFDPFWDAGRPVVTRRTTRTRRGRRR